MSDYALYYTLTKSIKSTELAAKQRASLMKFLKNPKLEMEQKKAIILLSSEHARVCDGHVFDPENIEFPYGIYEDKKGVHFNLKAMPNELKWILYKFSCI
jgi:hypothetical protein